MSFEHRTRGAGDVILSADWNAMGIEIQRVGGLLAQDEKKEIVTLPLPLRVSGRGTPGSLLSIAGGAAVGAGYADGAGTPENGLIVEGSAGVGTRSPKGKLQVVHQEQDANGNALVLGSDAGSNLRLGYHEDYSWVQSHGGRPLKVNPLGNDVSIGTQMVVQADGDVGVGTLDPKARLHVAGGAVRLDAGQEVFFAENGQIRSADDNHRILFRRNEDKLELREYGDIVLSSGAIAGKETAKLTVKASGNVGIGTATPGVRLEVAGVVKAHSVVTTNPLVHRMYPGDPIVHQEIFDAKAKGAIGKLGNPQYDDGSYSKTLWHGRHLIRYGGNAEADGNGAQVTIPAGYDTAWVRVLGERWTVFKAYMLDGGREDLGLWAGGMRSANSFCPDGSLSDGHHLGETGAPWGGTVACTTHQWMPIPVGRAGSLALVAKPNTNWDFWLSGLAFSRNPWAHAAHSALTYHWRLNGGGEVKWNTHDWNGDVLAEILSGRETDLVVPVLPSGRDKLLYLVEHNNNWNGCTHEGITVNGKPIERFLSTYDNPFARHWNGKFYERYVAARVPAEVVGSERYLKVRIDLGRQNSAIYFREIGTHDADVPPTT